MPDGQEPKAAVQVLTSPFSSSAEGISVQRSWRTPVQGLCKQRDLPGSHYDRTRKTTFITSMILVPLEQKKCESAGEPCSAGTPGVFTGLVLTSKNVSQLLSIPSPSPLSSAMQTGWHMLGEGLKASQGCWFTTDLPQETSSSLLPWSLKPTDYFCTWKLSNMETELLLEWCDKSKILLRSLDPGLLHVSPWELTAVPGFHPGLLHLCWWQRLQQDPWTSQSEMPLQLLMSKLNTK